MFVPLIVVKTSSSKQDSSLQNLLLLKVRPNPLHGIGLYKAVAMTADRCKSNVGRETAEKTGQGFKGTEKKKKKTEGAVQAFVEGCVGEV